MFDIIQVFPAGDHGDGAYIYTYIYIYIESEREREGEREREREGEPFVAAGVYFCFMAAGVCLFPLCSPHTLSCLRCVPFHVLQVLHV